MAQIEYDEGGGTFTYFLVLLYGLFVFVLTYFLWPRSKKDDGKDKLLCQCGPCCRKRTKLEKGQSFHNLMKYVKILVLVVFWALLIWLIYWTLTQERETIEWDPYEILQVDRGATTAEIRKQYRLLSKIHHPDKGGDPDVFTKIAKAYEALTDEVARDNWEKYGNPDGPRAATFGIALPSWVVDKNNSFWVLGMYVAVFMIALPIIVGTWWYRSVKFGTTNILIKTSQFYFYLLSRAKTIPLKRILMVLTTAIEFSNKQQAGVKDRPSDDIYLNQLVKQLEHSVRVDTREPPFNQTYVAKARLLLHSYLEHIEIQDPGLLMDQDAIVKYSPFLINEMMSILNQIWSYSKMSKGNKNMKRLPEPSVDMYESVMRLSQIVVQALWFPFQPLLQLPHINNDQLRYFQSKKRRISTIEEFAALKSEERRRLLKSLNAEEYNDVIIFCQRYPYIEMTVDTEVPDDEDSKLISAGSFVTIKIFLKRRGLLEHFGSSAEQEISSGPVNEDNKLHVPENLLPLSLEEETYNNKESLGGVEEVGGAEETGKSGKGQQKKLIKKKTKGGGKPQKKKQNVRKRVTDTQKQDNNDKKVEPESKPVEAGKDSSEESEAERNDDTLDDEEREWRELQKSIKKEQEQKKNLMLTSHLVHAPYFPADKNELWWAYIVDRKSNTVIVPPEKVTGLKDEKEVNLKMMAAERKGIYKYLVVVTSDSYLNCTVQQELKLMVHEKKEVSGKEQWEDLEKEEEEEDIIEESVTESEDDNSDLD